MTTETISSSRAYLETVNSMQQARTNIVTPYRYILEHGREWGPRIFPPKIRKMRDKQCFMNAYQVAQKHDLRYVEGVAQSVIPVDHAWCVNEAGEVIDPTWSKKFHSDRERGPSDYFGVEIPTDKLHLIMVSTGYYGVFGQWQKWDEVLEILKSK